MATFLDYVKFYFCLVKPAYGRQEINQFNLSSLPVMVVYSKQAANLNILGHNPQKNFPTI
jgi:hypothetical protein